MIEQMFVYGMGMGVTPSGPPPGPDSHRAKLSVVPRSVGADSNRRPGIQATTTDPPAWPAPAAVRAGTGPSPRQGVHMAGSDRTSSVRSGDREKALETALVQIERQFGKGSVMRLGDEVRAPMEVIPTVSIALDVALGIGGLPRGRVVEIYGPEGGGKTSLALHAIANAQKAGGIAAFIDAEHALDPDYAQKLGVDTDAMLVSQPDTGEQALEIMDMLIRSGALDIVVIDSVAALVPRAEIEGEMGDAHVGLQARLMSQALRKLTGTISRTSTSVIFINQLREKVGIVFGNPEVTPGGRALKFYASVRIDIRPVESIKKGTDVIGRRVKAKVVKNKVAAPFRQAEFDIMFDQPRGISRSGDVVDLGVEHGILTKSGAFYSYGDMRIGQGRENAKTFLDDNLELRMEIETEIRREAGLPVVIKPEPSPPPKAPRGEPVAAGGK